jgi:hypothetical protein
VHAIFQRFQASLKWSTASLRYRDQGERHASLRPPARGPLRQNDHYTISVAFAGGLPQTSRWTGDIESMSGPNGYAFHRTGQRVYQVVFDPVLGYFVDGPLVTAHGLRANFDATAFCAAFTS